MPSPTVLYVVATVVIALLFAWVGLVSKSRTVAWEATPEERERFAKLRPFAEGDFAGTPEDEEAPAAPAAKTKRKKAKAKAEEGEPNAELKTEGEPNAEPKAEEGELKAEEGEPKAEVESADSSSDSDEKNDKAGTTA